MNYYNVVQMSVYELKPNPKREFYKTPTPVAQLMQEIADSGGIIRDPLKVQKSTMTIIAGHTRWTVAKELGLKTIPVILYDVSDDEAEDLMIKDNALRSGTEEDLMRLARSMQRVKESYGRRQGRPLKTVGNVEMEKAGSKTSATAGVSEEISSKKGNQELAAMFNVGPKKWSEILCLLRLIPELQALISEGKIGQRAGYHLSQVTTQQQKTFYAIIKEDSKQTGYRVSKEQAKAFRNQCNRKEQQQEDAKRSVYQSTVSIQDIGEISLDFGETNIQETPVIVTPSKGTQTNSLVDLFGDETTELMDRVNNEFEFSKGVERVEVDKKKRAEIERFSNAFTDKEDQVGYKRSVAKRGIQDAKSSLQKIESQLPAYFSKDLFEDQESTEFSSALKSLEQMLGRLSAKVKALESQFRG